MFHDHTCLTKSKGFIQLLFVSPFPAPGSFSRIFRFEKSDFSFAKKKEHIPLSIFNYRNVASCHAIQDHSKLNSVVYADLDLSPILLFRMICNIFTNSSEFKFLLRQLLSV